MKSNSSGIIIINEFKQILICHVCGQNFWDLPKGKVEQDETPIQAAIRETNEETSLSFNESDLIEVGLYNYNKYKNLYLFKTFVEKDSIDLSKLRCSTNHYNEKQNISYPEIDDYKWIYLFDVEYHCSKSMIKIFDIINSKL